MTAGCGEEWTPTTSAEQLRAQAATLRDQHMSSDAYAQGITSQQLASMNDIPVSEDCL